MVTLQIDERDMLFLVLASPVLYKGRKDKLKVFL